MEIFPYRWRQAWNDWDLRSFILMSLTLQMILIFSGSHRNHVVSRWISFILWSAYLLADWVATFALGIFSNNHTGSDCASSSHRTLNEDRLAFWSPFLLLHLGGPDTITAFSLEDNELWMRHLMGLVFQVAVAFYVFVGSLPETRLTAPAAMMFLAEILKSGEKSWSLMSASMDSLRNSMVEPPDPGTNFAKPWKPNTSEDPISPVMMVTKAHQCFHTFKRLMVDLIILSFHDRNDSQSFFLKRSPIQASKVIETELSFVYEVLYNKSSVPHTVAEPWLRFTRFFSIPTAFLLFLFTQKHGYEEIDIIITCTLLVRALVLEIYSVALLAFSDWAFTAPHFQLRLRYKLFLAATQQAEMNKSISEEENLGGTSRWNSTKAFCCGTLPLISATNPTAPNSQRIRLLLPEESARVCRITCLTCR
ncbi:unnamed protein product [Musa acuminata var. zebrina]